jgi:hypothetical protein
MKSGLKKRDVKSERKGVSFPENIKSDLGPRERTWNDFRNRTLKKGQFTSDEMNSLISSMCTYANELSATSVMTA